MSLEGNCLFFGPPHTQRSEVRMDPVMHTCKVSLFSATLASSLKYTSPFSQCKDEPEASLHVVNMSMVTGGHPSTTSVNHASKQTFNELITAKPADKTMEVVSVGLECFHGDRRCSFARPSQHVRA